MLRKLLVFLMSFVILFMAIEPTSFAKPQNDDIVFEHYQKPFDKKNLKKEIVSDKKEDKEFKLKREEDNSEYKIKIKKKNDKYEWISTISKDGEVVYTNKKDIEYLSPDFSMSEVNALLDNQPELQKYYQAHIKFANEMVTPTDSEVSAAPIKMESTTQSVMTAEPQSEMIQPFILPLVVLGVYNITAFAIASLEVTVYSTLTVAMAEAVMDVYEQKRQVSTVAVDNPTSEYGLSKWYEFDNVATTVGSSGARHIDATTVATLANRMKNKDNTDNNLEIFMSTMKGRNAVMAVYDVKDSTPATINRNLGNYLDGSRIVDPAYKNLSIDLQGYTVFMAFNQGDNPRIFHAHYVPTIYRDKELQFQRYNRQYNVQIWPTFGKDNEYLEDAGRTATDQLQWEKRYTNRYNYRNDFLLNDSNGKKRIVPYK